MKTVRTLSDFCDMEIIRNDGVAEIVFDKVGLNKEIPVRLIGFYTDANKSDFEIREEGFYYYNELLNNSKDAQ